MSTKERSCDKSAPSLTELVRKPRTERGPGALICYLRCPCPLVFREVITTVGRLIIIILSPLFFFTSHFSDRGGDEDGAGAFLVLLCARE